MNWLLLKDCFYTVVKPIFFIASFVVGCLLFVGCINLMTDCIGPVWGFIVVLVSMIAGMTLLLYYSEKQRRGL